MIGDRVNNHQSVEVISVKLHDRHGENWRDLKEIKGEEETCLNV